MALTPEQVKDLNHETIVRGLAAKLESTEKDFKSLQTAMSLKNSQVIKIEAEVVRLKMTRTDKQLSEEVDGLRRQVSVKDRQIVDLTKAVETLRAEATGAIRRVDAVQYKFAGLSATAEIMQHARDEAQEKLGIAKLAFEAAVVSKDEAGRLWAKADLLAKSLEKVREQAVKAVRVLPAFARKSKEVRVLAALLKEPELVEEVKK